MTVKFTIYEIKFDKNRTITENIEAKTKITKSPRDICCFF